jgi:hypothetical protein
MSENRGLGRGIDALFGGDLASVLSDEDKSRVRQILIQDVTPDPRQPRHAPAAHAPHTPRTRHAKPKPAPSPRPGPPLCKRCRLQYSRCASGGEASRLSAPHLPRP